MPVEVYLLSAFPAGKVAAAEFHAEIAANGTVGPRLVGVTVDGDCKVGVTQALSAPEKSALNALVAAHQGTKLPSARLLASVPVAQATPFAVTAVAPAWQDVEVQPSKLDDLTPRLAATRGAVTARFTASGGACKLRVVERDSAGANELALSAAVLVPDGLAVARNLKFLLLPGVAPRAGTNVYALQAQKGSSLDAFQIDKGVLSVAELI